ncbi:MAG: nucleotide pyrophosphohydrolase [Longibaculum sp.]
MFEYNLNHPQDRLDFIEKLIHDFVEERDWHQYHTADNLSKSIMIEAAELLECFQWDDDYDFTHVCEELADVLIYSIQLSQYLNVDIKEIICQKMIKNKKKYPIEKTT